MDTKLMFKYLKKLPAKWLLVVIVIVWILGITLGLRLIGANAINYCIILTIIIVAVWLAYVLVKWILARRKAKGEGAEEVSIEGLAERLAKAAESSRDIPWYLVIGPSGSGKTSMLRNSDLDFSYVDSLQEGSIALGIEQTRNCDLFFTKNAVLLDTSGRYVDFYNEAQVKAEFLSILSLIKKLRKQNPIAALIVPVDISRLLYNSQEVVEKEARNIRYCIEEIISELQIRLPVYLVFTKCDLIYGFKESFGALGSDKRMQVWGSTLRREQTEKPELLFSKECSQLAHILIEHRDLRLASAQRRDRSAVYTFPLEFEVVYKKLTRFVGTTFQSISQEKPVFRGFYFTSSVQGEPLQVSFVMQNVAESLNRQAPAPEARPSYGEAESRGYFIRDLFEKAVFPDRDLYAPTKAAQRKSRTARLCACGAVFLVILALITTLSVSYVRSKDAIDDTQAAVYSVSRMGSGASGFDRDQGLERLRRSIVRLEGVSLLWREQKRDTANAARKNYLLWKYGSSNGSDVKLRRKVKIPVRVVKYEDGKSVGPDESVKINVGERTIHTNRKGLATFKTRIEDGNARFVFSTEYNPPGYERQQPQTCEIKPGETTSSREVRFIFSESMRTIIVLCKDESGKPLPDVPVSIIEKTGTMEKQTPEMSDERGIAQFGIDAPENTVFLVYCSESDTNCEAGPYEINIESGESEYSVEPQLSRKIEINVIAFEVTNGSDQLPKPAVLVSVGETKLGLTDNSGEWEGKGCVIPDKGNVTAEPAPSSFSVEETASGYSILLKYTPAQPPPPPPPPPPSLPSLQFAADLQSRISEIEVWMYVVDEETDGLEFIEEMSFESSGTRVRLGRLDTTVDDKKRLELPREAEENRLLLYHPDYWPQKLEWEQTEEQIEMVSIKQERSLSDFDQVDIDGAEYFSGIAQEYYNINDFGKAIENHQNAIRLVPRSRYYLRIGWAYFNNNQADDACREAIRGVELQLLDDPSSENVKEELQELLDLLSCKSIIR